MRQLKTGFDNEPCCVVGKNPKIREINDLIYEGKPFLSIAKRYGIKHDKYVSEHARECLNVYRNPRGVSGCYGTDMDWGATPRDLIWDGDPYGKAARGRWLMIAADVADFDRAEKL